MAGVQVLTRILDIMLGRFDSGRGFQCQRAVSLGCSDRLISISRRPGDWIGIGTWRAPFVGFIRTGMKTFEAPGVFGTVPETLISML